MAQENRQNYYFDPAGVPVRRKRGRPRKDDTSTVESSSRHQRLNRGNPLTSGSQGLLGQQVSGILDGTFDAGYLLSVQVGTTGLVFKGMVFDPRLASPICAENDIAPNLPMLPRNSVDPLTTTDASRVAAVPIANQMAQQNVRAYHPIPRNRPVTAPAQPVNQNDRELQSLQRNESAAVHTLNQVVQRNNTAVQTLSSDQPVLQNVRVQPIQRNVPAAVPASPQSTEKNALAAQPLLRNEPVAAVDVSVQKAQQNIGVVQPLQKIEPVAVPPPAHLQQNYKVVQHFQIKEPVSVLPSTQPGQLNYQVVQPLQVKEPVSVLPPALHVQQKGRIVQSFQITEPDANLPPVQHVQKNCGQSFEIVGHAAAAASPSQSLQEFSVVQPLRSNEPVAIPTELQSVQQNVAAVHHPESSEPATVRAIPPFSSKEQIIFSQSYQPTLLVEKVLQSDSEPMDAIVIEVPPAVVIEENVPVKVQVAGYQPGEEVQEPNLDVEPQQESSGAFIGIRQSTMILNTNSSVSVLPDSVALEIPQAEVQNAPPATKEAPLAVVKVEDVPATVQVAGHQAGEVVKAENLDADQLQESSGNFSGTTHSVMILNAHSLVALPPASTAPEPSQAEVHTAPAATKEVPPAVKEDVPVTIQVAGHQPRDIEEWNPNAEHQQELSGFSRTSMSAMILNDNRSIGAPPASSAHELPEAEVHNVPASTKEVLSAVLKEAGVPVTVQDAGIQPGEGVEALELDADQQHESQGCTTQRKKLPASVECKGESAESSMSQLGTTNASLQLVSVSHICPEMLQVQDTTSPRSSKPYPLSDVAPKVPSDSFSLP